MWYVVNCVPFMNFMGKVIFVTILYNFAHVLDLLVCRMEQWGMKENFVMMFLFLPLFQVNINLIFFIFLLHFHFRLTSHIQLVMVFC
jgi:hypothetical protein